MFVENMPKGIRPEGNERGSKSSLEKLAALLEGARPSRKWRTAEGLSRDKSQIPFRFAEL